MFQAILLSGTEMANSETREKFKLLTKHRVLTGAVGRYQFGEKNIPLEIVSQLGNPIITSSVKDDDKLIEHSTNPELIHKRLEHLVDIVIDGGYIGNIPSTVVDCTKSEFEILRQGKGDLIL